MKLEDFTEALENKYINISTSAKALNENLLEESFGDTSRVIDVAKWAYYNDLSEDEAIREVKKQLTKEGSVIPDNIKTIVFDTYDEEAEAEGYLTEDKDLSKVKGSMTQLLYDNRAKIDSCSSAKEIYNAVKEILSGAGLDTPATRRLLLGLSKKRDFGDALQLVYNSILKGSGEGVIKIK